MIKSTSNIGKPYANNTNCETIQQQYTTQQGQNSIPIKYAQYSSSNNTLQSPSNQHQQIPKTKSNFSNNNNTNNNNGTGQVLSSSPSNQNSLTQSYLNQIQSYNSPNSYLTHQQNISRDNPASSFGGPPAVAPKPSTISNIHQYRLQPQSPNSINHQPISPTRGVCHKMPPMSPVNSNLSNRLTYQTTSNDSPHQVECNRELNIRTIGSTNVNGNDTVIRKSSSNSNITSQSKSSPSSYKYKEAHQILLSSPAINNVNSSSTGSLTAANNSTTNPSSNGVSHQSQSLSPSNVNSPINSQFSVSSPAISQNNQQNNPNFEPNTVGDGLSNRLNKEQFRHALQMVVNPGDPRYRYKNFTKIGL